MQVFLEQCMNNKMNILHEVSERNWSRKEARKRHQEEYAILEYVTLGRTFQGRVLQPEFCKLLCIHTTFQLISNTKFRLHMLKKTCRSGRKTLCLVIRHFLTLLTLIMQELLERRVVSHQVDFPSYLVVELSVSLFLFFLTRDL